MKKTKIVIPALAVLLLSTAASVSGTVAWFSMNNKVTVSGMTVTTKVSSNLQIADGDLAHSEARYGDSLVQQRAGILEPVSTIDGINYFYTVKAGGNGAATNNGASTYSVYNEATGTALQNDYAKKAKYDAGFNTAYGFASPSLGNHEGVHWTSEEIAAAQEGDPAYGKTTEDWKIAPGGLSTNVCYGYIDYSFYLKGGYAAEGHRISMTKCNMLYNGQSGYGAITSAWAWRVGMFVTTATADTDVADGDVAVTGNRKTILAFQDSANQTPNNAVNGQSNTSLAPVLNPGASAIVDNNPTLNTTQRYKVIVRLWLEGEDVSCTTSTFAALTTDWKLDLEFKLGDPNASGFIPVNKITTVVE